MNIKHTSVKRAFPYSLSILFLFALFARPCLGQQKKSAIPLPNSSDGLDTGNSGEAKKTETEPEVPSRWVPYCQNVLSGRGFEGEKSCILPIRQFLSNLLPKF